VNSGLITPEMAFPIILGSYLGATITIVMGSLGNQPAIKKQVAAGHVGFNLLTALLGMLCLGGITFLFSRFIFPAVGIIMGLSLFYVGFRTIVALLVFPFVGGLAYLFQKWITDSQQDFPLAIQKLQSSPIDTELAILALKQDVLVYFRETISYNLNIWDFYLTDITQEQNIEHLLQRGEYFGMTSLKKEYQTIKLLQGKLLSFLALTNQRLLQKAEEEAELTALYQTIIDIGDSAKYLKDVGERVEDWQWSTSVDLQKDYEMLRKMVLDFYRSVLQVLANLDNKQAFSLLHEVVERIKKNDKKYLTVFKRKEGDDVDLANLIQVNRYFSASCLSLVKAIEGISLNAEEKKYVKEHLRGLF
jgi:Na+/phosphate symporter